MLDAEAVAEAKGGAVLTESQIRAALDKALGGKYHGARILVLIPDHTRTIPLPLLFKLVVDILHDVGRARFHGGVGDASAAGRSRLSQAVRASRATSV